MVRRYVYDKVLGMSSEIPDYGPKGDWVKYEDYERLKQEAMDHMASIQKQYDALARAYAELENKVATK